MNPVPKPPPQPKKHNRRFEEHRDPVYMKFTRGLGCILKGKKGHKCVGVVAACHLKSRATGAADYANVYPGCVEAHSEQHRVGIRYWAEQWFADPVGSGNGYVILKRIVEEEIPRQFREDI